MRGQLHVVRRATKRRIYMTPVDDVGRPWFGALLLIMAFLLGVAVGVLI